MAYQVWRVSDRKYEPQTYWQRRGEDYKAKDCPDELENLGNWLRSLKVGRILEVGPGWGRIYLKWQNLRLGGHYTMCDFVSSMQDGCERTTGVRPDLWDGENLPYPDNSFNLVLSFSVLLHVPPASVEKLLAEHARVSNRWIFVATLDDFDRQLSPHCFVHDNESLFEKLGFITVKKHEFGNRAHWLLEKKNGMD